MKIEFKEDVYYSYDTCLKCDALFNFISGERGNGKTYGYKTQIAMKNWFEKREQFVYLRRFANEVNLACRNFFNDIAHLYPAYKFKVSTIDKTIYFLCKSAEEKEAPWEVIGYGVNLNTSKNDKSVSYAGVSSICFDEFQSKKYLKSEVEEYFLDLYETISRTRDIPVYFLSNSITSSNPYFDYFHVQRPYGKRRYTLSSDGSIYCEHTLSKEYRNLKKQTRFGKLVEGSKFGQYAIDNEYIYENDDFIAKKGSGVKPVANLIYLDKTYGLWFDRRNGMLFFDDDHDDTQVTYALTREDHTCNTYFASRGRKVAWLNLMITGYESGFLYFKNQKLKRIGFEILDIIM